jgi:tetratricopeptide (TPR) repeat protein
MLSRMVGLRQGRFRFHAGNELLALVQPLEIPPLAHLLAGARAHLPLRTFVAALLPDRARFPRRAEAFAELVPQMSLGPRDLRIALDLNGALSTDEILQARRGQLREVASLLWFLRLVEAIAFDETRGAQAPGALPPLPAEKLKPLPAEQIAEIRESALAVLPSTYFHALGVDIAATADEVERAYLKITEQLHPDRFAGFDLAEVEDLLAQVQDKLAAAQRTLSSPEKRAGYLEHIFSRAGGLRGGRPMLVAGEMAMMEAQRALAGRRVHESVERARQATQAAPREPDFAAHLALLELLDRGRSDVERRSVARRAAKKALALEPESARAMVALALVAREEGDLTEARKQVLAALKLRPRMELARWLLRELNRVR